MSADSVSSSVLPDLQHSKVYIRIRLWFQTDDPLRVADNFAIYLGYVAIEGTVQSVVDDDGARFRLCPGAAVPAWISTIDGTSGSVTARIRMPLILADPLSRVRR